MHLQKFNREAARNLVSREPHLLGVSTSVWRTALEVAQVIGVATPAGLMHRNPQVFSRSWLSPVRLANRLALERCLGWTPAAVYKRYAGYVATMGSGRLAGRLLFLEQQGLLPLLVADKQQAKEQ